MTQRSSSMVWFGKKLVLVFDPQIQRPISSLGYDRKRNHPPPSRAVNYSVTKKHKRSLKRQCHEIFRFRMCKNSAVVSHQKSRGTVALKCGCVIFFRSFSILAKNHFYELLAAGKTNEPECTVYTVAGTAQLHYKLMSPYSDWPMQTSSFVWKLPVLKTVESLTQKRQRTDDRCLFLRMIRIVPS